LIVRNLRSKKKWVEDFEKANELAEELQLTYDFFKEGDATEEELDTQYELTNNHLEDIEFRNMLSDEGDNLSAVLQITAGAGGTESCDWASMLMRMYLMWAEKQKYKVKELNFQEGDVAGIKTVTLEIEGDFAFGYLKGENGVHRYEFRLLIAMLNVILLLHRFMFIHWLMIL
jgi:peptide chain release factor 2